MLVNLGVVHLQTKRYDQSEKELLRALDAFRSLGRRSEEAQALGNLGTLYEKAGKPARAQESYQGAVTIFGELGEKENQQATLGALTRLQMGQNQWLQSLFTYEKMAALGQKLTLKQRIFRWFFKIVSKLMRWQ
jgi:tetratricopeptide (TPR) repeat protein